MIYNIFIDEWILTRSTATTNSIVRLTPSVTSVLIHTWWLLLCNRNHTWTWEEKKQIWRKRKFGYVVAGAHLSTSWLFEPAKRPDDRADYCRIHNSELSSSSVIYCRGFSGNSLWSTSTNLQKSSTLVLFEIQIIAPIVFTDHLTLDLTIFRKVLWALRGTCRHNNEYKCFCTYFVALLTTVEPRLSVTFSIRLQNHQNVFS